MKTSLLIVLATTTAASLLTGCADTGPVAQHSPVAPTRQKGDGRPSGVSPTAQSTGASQGHTVDLAINNLN